MREANELVLADLLRLKAESDPDLPVLTFEHLSLGDGSGDEVRTFADLHRNSNSLAAALRERGVRGGSPVAVMMRNHPEFVETLGACSILGALAVPIDPRTRGDKLLFMLGHSGACALVAADYCLEEIQPLRHSLPALDHVLALDSGEDPAGDGTWVGVESLSQLAAEAATLEPAAAGPDDPLQIIYTSGTTGDPKGIVISNARFCMAGMLGALFGYGEDERPYSGLSLSHGNAQSVTLAPALTMGLEAVFSRRFSKSRLWDVCRRYGCTSLSLVGGMATAIYGEPARDIDGDNPVRMVVSGGMPPAIWEAFERRFGVRILEFYGAMDGGGMAYKPVGEGPVGSFGRPMAGIDMKILDGEGRECPPGTVGEICVRPAGGGEASVEYFANAEASRAKIRSGWNRSGDMGHTDDNGWFFFDYRSGGGIRHNGDFIEPSRVEKALAEEASVTDVFVYGVPAASGAPGEKDVVAAVVAAAGVELIPQRLFDACREKLETNSVPSYLQVVEELPKTASEKPLERLLAAQFDPARAGVYSEKRRR